MDGISQYFMWGNMLKYKILTIIIFTILIVFNTTSLSTKDFGDIPIKQKSHIQTEKPITEQSNKQNFIENNKLKEHFTTSTSRGTWRIVELNAIVTAYDAGFNSTGKYPSDPDYGITASGKKAQPYHTVALPPEFPFGTLVIIDDPLFQGIVFVNEDRGGAIKRIDENTIKIDVFFATEKEALEYGKQYRKVLLKIPE